MAIQAETLLAPSIVPTSESPPPSPDLFLPTRYELTSRRHHASAEVVSAEHDASSESWVPDSTRSACQLARSPPDDDDDDVGEALMLLQDARSDLEAALSLLVAPRGIVGGVRQTSKQLRSHESIASSLKSGAKSLAHDGRLDAKALVNSAVQKIEQAVELVDGLPNIAKARINPGIPRELAYKAAGKMGPKVADATMVGARVASAVLIHTPVGLVHMAVKRVRTRRGASSVRKMLEALDSLLAQFEQEQSAEIENSSDVEIVFV